MTAEQSSGHDYTMGYSDEFLQLLDRRNAANSAAHLLPHLQPGARLLDLGCGPGSITVGLAAAVNPGEVHGIDMEESQIGLAQAAAAAGGHTNATFQAGNALSLPFEDNFFDVVHAHAVLMHIPDTAGVLAEVKRVLKPDGIFACRDMIGESCFFEPVYDGLKEAWEVFTGLMRGNGGHPEIGKEMKGILLGAGFADVQSSASFDSYATDDDIAFFYGFVIDWFFSEPLIQRVSSLGIAPREKFDFWRSELDKWRQEPGAFATLAWGEHLARNG